MPSSLVLVTRHDAAHVARRYADIPDLHDTSLTGRFREVSLSLSVVHVTSVCVVAVTRGHTFLMGKVWPNTVVARLVYSMLRVPGGIDRC